MNRIMVGTVIRGKGECQAYINGVVSAEMQRQQAMMRAKNERAAMVESSRNRMLAARMDEINRRANRRPNLLQQLADVIVETWAVIWGMHLYGDEMLIGWLVKKGLLVEVEQ